MRDECVRWMFDEVEAVAEREDEDDTEIWLKQKKEDKDNTEMNA